MVSSTLKIIGYLCVACLMVQAQNPAQKTNPSTISGKVTFKGKGLPGISVGARSTQSGRSRNTLIVTTDQLGNYRIPNVAPGEYEVMPAAPQYLVGGLAPIKSLIVGEGENLENVDFVLVRGGVITGKVVDADGRPMIEEPVEIFPMGGTDEKPLVLMNVFSDPTDDRGVYRIWGLRPGKYRVAAGLSQERMYARGTRSVFLQTYHPSTTVASEATIIVVTEGSETTNVDITLRRTVNVFTVYARVVDSDGKPLPNAIYALQKFEQNSSMSTSGFNSDSRGEIKIDNVTPGKYALYLEPSKTVDVYTEPVRFEVVDQDVKDLVIKASSGGSVSGAVVLDGVDEKLAVKPNELTILARIENKDPYNHVPTPSAVINPDGSFKVGGLRPGVVQLAVWGQRQGVAYEVTQIARDGVVQTGVEIKPGEHITGLRLIVKARTGRVRGQVKLENGRIAFSQVSVNIRKIGKNSGVMPQVDDRGRFLSDPLAAGLYDVVVTVYTAHGRPISTKQQVAVADNQVAEVMLTLDLISDPGQGRP